MGGPGSGRRPDDARRRQAAELRALGLTWVEIGRRLGISNQAVGRLLGRVQRPAVSHPPVRCAACGRPISGSGAAGKAAGAVYCPACLPDHPDAPFAARLTSLRLARGISRAELARRSGVSGALLLYYERGVYGARPTNLAKLARALGVRPEDLAGG